LVPTQQNWLDSGKLLARIAEDQGFTASKLRDMHFDVLIALTARSHGARLITANRADFELIKRYSDFQLEVW
jgi:predicted nucleic acid-binding protein